MTWPRKPHELSTSLLSLHLDMTRTVLPEDEACGNQWAIGPAADDGPIIRCSVRAPTKFELPGASARNLLRRRYFIGERNGAQGRN